MRRRPDASMIALAFSIGVALFVAGYYAADWLRQPAGNDYSPEPIATPFDLAQTRKSVVFVKCLTPGLPPSVGSGFLVSDDGLIYTNRHVVQPDYPIQGSIILVGVPSAGNPDRLDYFRAEIAHAAPPAEQLDFAALKIAAKSGYGPFTAMPVSQEALGLGSAVAVLGYPFINSEQRVLAFNKGSVSAQRVVLDQHAYYQTDAAINPGNSGGPLVSARGEAIGIVTLRKTNAENMGYALYLKEVQAAAALARRRAVELRPEPGPLNSAALPSPPTVPPETWTVVRGDSRIERGVFTVHNHGDSYCIATRDALPENFQIVMNCRVEPMTPKQATAGDLRQSVDELCLRFGAKEIDIDITRPRPSATWMAMTSYKSVLWHGSQEFENKQGTPDDPFVLTVARHAGVIQVAVDQQTIFYSKDETPQSASHQFSIGGYLSRLSLAEVSILKLDPKAPPLPVNYAPATTTPNQRPRNVGPPVLVPVTDPPSLVRLKPPELEADMVVRPMPAKIKTLDVGGGGRYFVLHFPDRSELAIFDVSEAKIVRAIPLTEPDVKFAAGLDKLIIAYPKSKTIERWNLATGVREAVGPLTLKQPLAMVVMGSASRGPALLGAGEGTLNTEIAFLDVHTLKPLDIQRTGQSRIHLSKAVQIRSSDDGNVFAVSGSPLKPSGLTTLVLSGNEARGYYSAEGAGHAAPGPDGRVIYTFLGRFSQDAKPIGKLGREQCCFPAHQGVYSLTFDISRVSPFNINGGRLSVHIVGDDQPIAQDIFPKQIMQGIDAWNNGDFSADKRIHYIPSAKLFVAIPGSNDKLVLFRFDADEVLAKSGVDYLIVTSLPPIWARAGATYRYQIGVKSRKPVEEFHVIAGPKGLAISRTGLVTWRVPTDFADPETEVVIGIRNQTRQEVQHAFKVTLRD